MAAPKMNRPQRQEPTPPAQISAPEIKTGGSSISMADALSQGVNRGFEQFKNFSNAAFELARVKQKQAQDELSWKRSLAASKIISDMAAGKVSFDSEQEASDAAEALFNDYTKDNFSSEFINQWKLSANGKRVIAVSEAELGGNFLRVQYNRQLQTAKMRLNEIATTAWIMQDMNFYEQEATKYIEEYTMATKTDKETLLNEGGQAANLALANRMIETDPAKFLQKMKSEKDFLKYLPPNTKEALRKTAVNTFDNIKYKKGIAEIAAQGTNAAALFEKHLNGNITVDQIENADITAAAKAAMYKIAGFNSIEYRQNQRSLENAAVQIELNNKFMNIAAEKNAQDKREDRKKQRYGQIETTGKYKLSKDASLLNALSFTDDVYTALADGNITQAQAVHYIKDMGQTVFETYKKFADGTNSTAPVENVFTDGLKQVNAKIAEKEITDDVVKANIQNTYTQAIVWNLEQLGYNAQQFYDLDVIKQNELQKAAIDYTFAQIPDLQKANRVFNFALFDKELQSKAQKNYIAKMQELNGAGKDLSAAQQETIARQITNKIISDEREAINKEIYDKAQASADERQEKEAKIKAILANPQAAKFYRWAIENPDDADSKDILKRLGL